MAVSGNWWNDHAPASPPAVCAEKTSGRFPTREVTDVMPKVFTHLKHRGGICEGTNHSNRRKKQGYIKQYMQNWIIILQCVALLKVGLRKESKMQRSEGSKTLRMSRGWKIFPSSVFSGPATTRYFCVRSQLRFLPRRGIQLDRCVLFVISPRQPPTPLHLILLFHSCSTSRSHFPTNISVIFRETSRVAIPLKTLQCTGDNEESSIKCMKHLI